MHAVRSPCEGISPRLTCCCTSPLDSFYKKSVRTLDPNANYPVENPLFLPLLIFRPTCLGQRTGRSSLLQLFYLFGFFLTELKLQKQIISLWSEQRERATVGNVSVV